jgi:hypothetical protein
MPKTGKAKKTASRSTSDASLEVTKHSIKVTGKRPVLWAVAVVFALGTVFILINEVRPEFSASVYGNNGIAIGQARDLTISHDAKESK